MTRSSPWPALLLLAACSASASKPPTSGTGGDTEEGGTGGGSTGGKGGTGGTAPKPDAMAAPERDAGADAGTEACEGPPGSLLCNPLAALPRTIKETGLFPMAPDLSKRPARLREYAPDPALWSDGLEKQRFLLLPAGKKIDNSDPKRWDFPVGTVFIKTFFDDGPTGPRPVETRLIRRVGGPDAFEPYDYNVYQWKADGTDATLAEIELRIPVMVTVKKLGAPFSHDIPSRQDCGACHDSNAKVASPFIGFDELRLHGKLAPGSAKSQLEELADVFMKLVTPVIPEITDPDPRLQRIKRWVFGNCVHCHNGSRGVDLRPEVLVMNTVGKPIDASGITPPAGWLRVVPGKPEMSIVFVQARRTMLPTGLRAMPPVGVAVADAPAVEDLRAWIMGLR